MSITTTSAARSHEDAARAARRWMAAALLAASAVLPALASAEVLEQDGCIEWSQDWPSSGGCVVRQRCWLDESLGAQRCTTRDVRDETGDPAATFSPVEVEDPPPPKPA
jgi:hypothetical protein